MTAPSAKKSAQNIQIDNAIANQLSHIKVVMVNTTLPANIGSAARAMFTMGLTNLVVVNPKLPIDNTSVSHATGAQSVLESTKVVDSLEDALVDCRLVFAASSRQRHIPRPVVTPTQATQIILQNETLQNATTEVTDHPSIAILFGREDRGLTNKELALADYHIQIDANPNYPVLNVASAVQVISSFIYSGVLSHQQHLFTPSVHTPDTTNSGTNHSARQPLDVILRQEWDAPATTHKQKLKLQSRIIELMHTLELIDSTEHKELRDLPSRLSRLLSRLQLDQKEYEILSSIIAKIKIKT